MFASWTAQYAGQSDQTPLLAERVTGGDVDTLQTLLAKITLGDIKDVRAMLTSGKGKGALWTWLFS